MSMDLSKRLRAVAELTAGGKRSTTVCAADIGTDHGYIPISLIKEKEFGHVIAMDVNRGPLERARCNIALEGLEGYIETRLSDGLKELADGEVQCVVIAGMGGALCIKILEEGKKVVEGLQYFVLQPQSEIWKVRAYLQENKYRIVEEDMVLEDGKYYPMMRVEKGEDSPYSKVELWYGRVLLKNRHPVLKDYLEFVTKEKERILKSLKTSPTERAKNRALEVEKELQTAKEGLSCYVEKS